MKILISIQAPGHPIGLAALFLLLTAPFIQAQAAPPLIERWERSSPDSEVVYNVSSVTWRLQFDQWVDDVDSDFRLENCSGCNLRVSPSNGQGTVFHVTVSGDALGDRDHSVELSIRSDHDIRNSSGERLPNNKRFGTVVHEGRYIIRNKPYVLNVRRASPTSYDTNANSVSWTYEFSEPMADVEASDFYLQQTTATLSLTNNEDDRIFTLTASGGDLAGLNRQIRIWPERNHDMEDKSGNALVTRTPALADETRFRIDNERPQLRYMERHDPTGKKTTGDSITFLFRFHEDVVPQKNHFGLLRSRTYRPGWIIRSSATSVTKYQGSSREYLVNFSDLKHRESLLSTFVVPNRLPDKAGNTCNGGLHYEEREELDFFNDQYYDMDNKHPRIAFLYWNAQDEAFQDVGEYMNVRNPYVRMDWNEDVTGFEVSDISVSGGNIAFFNDDEDADRKYGMRLTAAEEGSVTISVPENAAKDGHENESLVFSRTVIFDWTAPRVSSIVRQSPTNRVTNSDTVTWRVTFSESVQHVTAWDFILLGGATGSFTVREVQGSSGVRYDVTAKDGNLANFDGTVSLGFKSGQNIADPAGNALSNTTPIGTNDDYLLDNTAPTVAIEGIPAIANTPFTAELRFSETVSGFEVGDITATGANLSSFTATQTGRVWTVQVTPSADYRLAVAAGVASDAAGNSNVANDGEGAQGRFGVANAGLTMAPASLTIAEGESETFTVALAALPTGTVTVAISSNHDEVTVDPSSLTFTTSNWNVAQTGTVSAAEDDDVANESATLTVDPSGGGYDDLANGSMPVTVTDDDAAGAGLTMAPASLTITEGESGTFTVALAAAPTGTVTVAISSDHDEVTVDPTSLTFTTANWNVAQTGTVSAAEDDDVVNDSATLTADPSGGGYGDVADDTLPVTVTDDDASGAGLTMAPESLTIAEGESETFTLALAAAPTGTVSVSVSSDHDEVTVSPANLTFTTSNWSVAQTGTVSAAKDDDVTNDSATLIADPSGGGYGDLADGSMPVTVTDGSAGLTMAPESLTIAEGESESLTVALAAAPTGTVTVVVSSDHGEVAVDPASLTFTTANWSVAQTGTVSAAEDDDAVNDKATLTAYPSGGGYSDLADDTLPVTVTDDDVSGAGLTMAPESLTIAEGESGTFTVALAVVPAGTVTVAVLSSDREEMTVSPTSLTFTTSNWSVAQTGTVSAVEDDDATNENITLIADPSGGGYDSLADGTLPVTVTDDDAAGAGLTLAPASLAIGEGESGTFTVVLAAAPTGTVTVAVSSDHGEVTVNPTSLTFTTANWNVAQTGVVSAAEDDDAANDSATLTADPSGGGYGDLADGTLPVTVTDDDAAGAGLTLAPESLTIAEGESGTFTVALAAVPTGTVTVAVSSDHDEVTVNPASLTFTTANWSVAQTGTVSAAEDDDATNDSATLSADPSGGGYGDVADGNLPVTVTDDDAAGAGLTLAPESLTIAEGESGTFTLALAAVPTGTVTVAVSSNHREVTVSPVSLTFTTSNWSVAQTGTISAAEDNDTANDSATLTADPSGGGYDDLADDTLSVTVTDDDAAGAGLSMAPASLTIAEGESGTFTVALSAAPTGTVTVAVSSDHDEVIVDPASLTFTTANWSVAQTGTVSATEDDDTTNDSATLTADPSGGGYGDVADGTLPVTVTDDDVSGAGLAMAPASLTIAEGESGTFTVALAAVPTGTVTVAVSSDHDEVTASPTSLTFTTSNWNVAQTGTVSAAEDGDATNDSAMLTADPSGGGYGDLADGTLPVTVTDDDAAGAGLTMAPESLTIAEGESETFTLALAAVPLGTVTVAISSDHDGVSVDPANLTFTTSNWSVAQTGTVSAAEDDDETNESAMLTADPSGGGYGDLADGILPVTVIDDEGPGEEVAHEKKVVEEILANASLGLLRSARDVLRQRLEAEPESGLEIDFSGALRALETDSAGSAGMSEALSDSHFTLALDGESGQGSGWTIWGRGSYLDIEGEGRSDSDHEIELQTAWLGLDRNFGDDVLGGVALSYADMEADYSLNPTGEALRKGELEMELTAVHPYARWERSAGSEAWAMLGFGQGDVELTSDITDNKTIESDVDYWMITVGGREALNPVSDMALALVADVGYARLETDATAEESAIDDLRLESWQARAGVEAQTSWGDGTTPFGAVYGRYDGGDGAEGVGLELRGGLSMMQPASRLQLDIEGHWVAAHSESDYEEWGASLMAAVLPAADRRGWSWQLRSGLGQEANDSSVLWGEEKLESLVETEQSHELSLSTSVSWGFGWAGRGVLTPFAEAAMKSGEWDEAKLGLRYILPETERLSLELSLGQRQEDEVGHYIGVEIDLRN